MEKRKIEEPVVETTEEVVTETAEEIVTESEEEVVLEESNEPAKFGIVTCDKLNVRKTPEIPESKDSNVIKVINKGTSVVVYEEIGDFVKINVDGENAYCMKKFIEVK